MLNDFEIVCLVEGVNHMQPLSEPLDRGKNQPIQPALEAWIEKHGNRRRNLPGLGMPLTEVPS